MPHPGCSKPPLRVQVPKNSFFFYFHQQRFVHVPFELGFSSPLKLLVKHKPALDHGP